MKFGIMYGDYEQVSHRLSPKKAEALLQSIRDDEGWPLNDRFDKSMLKIRRISQREAVLVCKCRTVEPMLEREYKRARAEGYEARTALGVARQRLNPLTCGENYDCTDDGFEALPPGLEESRLGLQP